MKLLKSSALNEEDRRETASKVVKRLSQATGPAHDPHGLSAFADELRRAIKAPVRLSEIDAQINDQAFANTAAEIFDTWLDNRTKPHP